MTVDGRPKRAAVAEFRLGDLYSGEALPGRQLAFSPLPDPSHHGGPPARAATCRRPNSVLPTAARGAPRILTPFRRCWGRARLRSVRARPTRRRRGRRLWLRVVGV